MKTEKTTKAIFKNESVLNDATEAAIFETKEDFPRNVRVINFLHELITDAYSYQQAIDYKPLAPRLDELLEIYNNGGICYGEFFIHALEEISLETLDLEYTYYERCKK